MSSIYKPPIPDPIRPLLPVIPRIKNGIPLPVMPPRQNGIPLPVMPPKQPFHPLFPHIPTPQIPSSLQPGQQICPGGAGIYDACFKQCLVDNDYGTADGIESSLIAERCDTKCKKHKDTCINIPNPDPYKGCTYLIKDDGTADPNFLDCGPIYSCPTGYKPAGMPIRSGGKCISNACMKEGNTLWNTTPCIEESVDCGAKGVEPSSCYLNEIGKYTCTRCVDDSIDPSVPPDEAAFHSVIVTHDDGSQWAEDGDGNWVNVGDLPDHGTEISGGDVENDYGVELYEKLGITTEYLEAIIVGGIPVGFVAMNQGYPSLIVVYGGVALLGPKFVKEVSDVLWKYVGNTKKELHSWTDWLTDGTGIMLITGVGGIAGLMAFIVTTNKYKILPDSVMGYTFVVGSAGIGIALLLEYFIYKFNIKDFAEGLGKFFAKASEGTGEGLFGAIGDLFK